jgi:Tol biopolymer transport system component
MKIIYRILVLTFITLIVGCEKDSYTFTDLDNQILFISRRVENTADWYLMSMNGDGTNQKIISEIDVRCEKPSPSNDGQKIVFTHYSENNTYELYLINTDGTNLTIIDTANRYCGSADWSFDNTKVIYSKNRNPSTDERDLILYDLITEEKKVLTTNGDNYSAVFNKQNEIIFCNQSNSMQSNIYKMNVDGSNMQLLITNACNPVPSPNGEEIAYQSNIENGSSQIFVAKSDGSDQKQLTSSYSSESWPGWPPEGNSDPQWTPNGKKIIYVSGEDGDPEIYIMASSGSNKSKLTNTNSRDEYPNISFCGQYILFSSNRNIEMKSDIYIMDLNGNNQKCLTNYSGADIFPIEI